MKRTLYLLWLLPVIAGCRFACVEGHGPVRPDIRNVTGFTGVRLSIPAEVVVTRGRETHVQVEAEDNLIDEIRTTVRGGSLRIRSDRCLKSAVRIRIQVTMPELDELQVNGSGDILVPDTFQVDKLKLTINGSGSLHARLIAAEIRTSINGSGDVELTGSANRHKVKIAGSGDVDAMKMPCNTAEVRVMGSGDVFAYAIEKLDVRVNGSGDVHYKGKPSVSTRINGSGKVVDDN